MLVHPQTACVFCMLRHHSWVAQHRAAGEPRCFNWSGNWPQRASALLGGALAATADTAPFNQGEDGLDWGD